MLTIHRLSAGDGYKYLLQHVASGDVDRAASTTLTSYYSVSGYPPGRWCGSGLAGLAANGGGIRDGDAVTEEQMAALFGRAENPVDGKVLGRTYPVFRTWSERVTARIADLDPDLSAAQRRSEVNRIRKEESNRRTRHAVAGFDLTFSPMKSVSALWAVADSAIQEQVVTAHHEAVRDVLRLIETDAAFTRTGDGGLAQIDTLGLIAAAFDHWDTRSGDPQLHTHVVVANRIQGTDGRWRTLDGRSLYQSCVAMSEMYNDLLADRLADRLGVAWTHRDRGENRNAAWEIDGIPDALLTEFSARTAQIEANLQRLLTQYREANGRSPSRRQLYALRQQATLMDRPPKDGPQPLARLTEEWRRRAQVNAGVRPADVIARAVARSHGVPLTSTQISTDEVGAYAFTVVLAVQQRRSTWTRWNLLAEAARQTRELRLATADDRISVANRIADQAETESISLAAPDLIDVPDRLRRRDGASMFSVHNAAPFTSTAILEAEALLLDHTKVRTGPTASPATLPTALSVEQADAVRRIATSGQIVEALHGAAGTGKTTTLAALRQVWESAHGPGSVVGLAPSAAAAQVLGERVGIPTENTAKWIHESTRSEPWRVRRDQLMIVDEASLAATPQLATLTRQVADAGAKLLLVGDDAQLSAVESGGAFRLIARDTNAASLNEIHRFHHRWEAGASIRLRRGDGSAITTYLDHDRLHSGTDERMQDAAYLAWRADEHAGLRSLLIAADNETVSALNVRARLDRIKTRHVEAAGVPLRDGTEAGVGDRIVTRLNQRRITTNRGRYVRNGNQWTIIKRWRNGSLTARAPDGDTVTLPAWYVAQSVELGYATTAHRAQGCTVDTAHLLATEGLSREVLYVAMTRGRKGNHVYVVTARTTDEGHQHGSDRSIRDVLESILAHTDAERSAHEVMREELNKSSRLDRLVPIHEHLCQIKARDRYPRAFARAGLADHAAELENSPSFGPLIAALRHAENRGLPTGGVLRLAIEMAPLHTAKDIAAVLHARIDRLVRRAERRGTIGAGATIAGLVSPTDPTSVGALPDALRRIENLIGERASELVRRAIAEDEPWLRNLDPRIEAGHADWQPTLERIAAFRERHGLTGADPFGHEPPATAHAQSRDWRNLRSHVRQLLPNLSGAATLPPTSASPAPRRPTELEAMPAGPQRDRSAGL